MTLYGSLYLCSIPTYLGVEKTDKLLYDDITALLTTEELASAETNPVNPINKFERFSYKETVWPREQNTYLAKIRVCDTVFADGGMQTEILIR